MNEIRRHDNNNNNSNINSYLLCTRFEFQVKRNSGTQIVFGIRTLISSRENKLS